MSADASINLRWADGTYRFRLGIGEWSELQSTCDAGLVEILDRLQARRWRMEDVRETIRLGLIGGGMPSAKAMVLIIRHVDGRPMEHLGVASAILAAALIGAPDDPVGKPRAEGSDGTAGSASPPSMAPPAPPVSAPPR